MKEFVLILFVISAGIVAKASDRISLAEYLKTVDCENLQLRASQASVAAAEARAIGVQIPEPMVGYMQMTDSSGTANGIEVFQTIPFPSKLTHDRNARQLGESVEKANAESIRSEILAQARLIYFNVWAAQSRIQFLKEKQAIIREHLRLSTASTRSDSSLRIHTLKAASDFDLMESDIVEAEQNFREKQILMASFANKDPDQYRPEVEEPPMAIVPSAEKLERSPGLEYKHLNLQMMGEREAEAKSSWFPDFNLRYREIGDTAMASGYREVMVGVTLPFAFFWGPEAKSKSAVAEKAKAETDYEETKLRLKSKTAQLKARAESFKKQIELIQTKILPRTEKRLRLVHNLAPRDIESLQEHREIAEAFPDLKLKELDLRIQYEEAVAELAALAPEEKLK